MTEVSMNNDLKSAFSLAGRRALVTGSARGIGRAIARALAEYGATVAVHGVHASAPLDAALADVRVFSPASVAVTGDLGAPGFKKYDIEAYFAGFGGYREVTSNTNLTSFQSRRLNIRYKDSANDERDHGDTHECARDLASVCAQGADEEVEPQSENVCNHSSPSASLMPPDSSMKRCSRVSSPLTSSTVPSASTRPPTITASPEQTRSTSSIP